MKSKNNPDQLAVIFLHIPKTAGSSLYSILQKQYPSSRSFKLKANAIPESLRIFKNLSEKRRSKMQLIYGHLDFGLHRFIPGQSTYFTLLRDPVDRIISHYYYVLRRPGHYLYKKVAEGKMSIKQYVSSAVSGELNNGQVRLISGIGPEFRYDQCTPELLEQAKNNLKKHFILTGLTEFFDETILLLKEKLNWKLPVYFKEKVTFKRPTISDLDKETIETIKHFNQLDIMLYEDVKKEFTLTLDTLGKFFEAKINAFRYINENWRHQFLKIFPNIKIRIRADFSNEFKKQVISQCKLKINEEHFEVAYWLIQYALELFPLNHQLNEMVRLLPVKPG